MHEPRTERNRLRRATQCAPAERRPAAARRCGSAPPRRYGRAPPRRHDPSALAAPARALSGQADRAAGALGREPRPSASSWRSATRAGGWRTLTYAQTLAQVRAHRRRRCCNASCRPSGRSRSCPATTSSMRCWASPPCMSACRTRRSRRAYSLISQDFGKLKSIIETADAGSRLRRRRRAVRARDRGGRAARRRDRRRPPIRWPSRPTTLFADCWRRPTTAAVDAAHAKVGPDTIAKFLFTSGSTGMPKGVINTQRMCAPTRR